MTSKAERKRAKKRISLAGGQSVPQRPQGRDRSHTHQPAEDPRKTAITARLRISGISDQKEAESPLLGEDMGRCLHFLAKGDERAALADAWAAISASLRNFRLMVIGQTGTPQGAAIAMVPEPMQTDPSLRVDLRTQEQKVAAAKASWAAWEGKVKALPFGLKWVMEGVLYGFMGEAVLWKDQRPTEKGRLAVEALRRMAGVK